MARLRLLRLSKRFHGQMHPQRDHIVVHAV